MRRIYCRRLVIILLFFITSILLIFKLPLSAARYIEGGADIYSDFGIVHIREGQYTITDEKNYFYQQYDTINLLDKTGYSRQDLLQMNIKTLILIFQLDVKEVNDGYQEFYVFSQTELGQIVHASYLNFEHGSGYKNTSFKRYEFYCELNIENIGNEFYLGYGAHGSSSDTWVNKNLEIQICISKEEQQKTELYWVTNGVN